MNWIDIENWPPRFDDLILMFQREVAERIVATPAAPHDYGRLSVFCGWRTEAKILFDVSPQAFTPPPKIVSSVVRLTPRAHPLACDPKILARVTQAAFGQRRKMLRQSLKSLGVDPIALCEIMASIQRRAPRPSQLSNSYRWHKRLKGADLLINQ